MKQEKKLNQNGFFKWAYKKWQFWLIIILYSLLIGYEEIALNSLGEFIVTVIISFIFVNIIFGFIYLIKILFEIKRNVDGLVSKK